MERLKAMIIGVVVVSIAIAAIAMVLMKVPSTEEKIGKEKHTKVELTGNFEEDVIKIGKALEGFSECPQ